MTYMPGIAMPRIVLGQLQFITLNRMLDAGPAFRPRHPDAELYQIDMIPTQGGGF